MTLPSLLSLCEVMVVLTVTAGAFLGAIRILVETSALSRKYDVGRALAGPAGAVTCMVSWSLCQPDSWPFPAESSVMAGVDVWVINGVKPWRLITSLPSVSGPTLLLLCHSAVKWQQQGELDLPIYVHPRWQFVPSSDAGRVQFEDFWW